MPDIGERFRVFDSVEVPDLWPDARSRVPRPRQEPGARRSKALVASVVALLVSGAAISGLWYAFTQPGEQPNAPSMVETALVRVTRSGDSISAMLTYGGNAQSGQVDFCPIHVIGCNV